MTGMSVAPPRSALDAELNGRSGAGRTLATASFLRSCGGVEGRWFVMQ